ncbi:MAG TPA: hypothetical protein DEA47_05195 [Peptococcaceae bacterium]|nr:MAG: Putative inhibitor of sigma-G Gin [Clostridia bacterium 41_269]HBT20739.1 hypothetical protein [Peptococcaceae bacterium]
METGDNVLPKCIVCETTPRKGFKEGIFIGKKFLCFKCEKVIIGLKTSDKDYCYYFNKMKKVWFK